MNYKFYDYIYDFYLIKNEKEINNGLIPKNDLINNNDANLFLVEKIVDFIENVTFENISNEKIPRYYKIKGLQNKLININVGIVEIDNTYNGRILSNEKYIKRNTGFLRRKNQWSKEEIKQEVKKLLSDNEYEKRPVFSLSLSKKKRFEKIFEISPTFIEPLNKFFIKVSQENISVKNAKKEVIKNFAILHDFQMNGLEKNFEKNLNCLIEKELFLDSIKYIFKNHMEDLVNILGSREESINYLYAISFDKYREQSLIVWLEDNKTDNFLSVEDQIILLHNMRSSINALEYYNKGVDIKLYFEGYLEYVNNLLENLQKNNTPLENNYQNKLLDLIEKIFEISTNIDVSHIGIFKSYQEDINLFLNMNKELIQLIKMDEGYELGRYVENTETSFYRLIKNMSLFENLERNINQNKDLLQLKTYTQLLNKNFILNKDQSLIFCLNKQDIEKDDYEIVKINNEQYQIYLDNKNFSNVSEVYVKSFLTYINKEYFNEEKISLKNYKDGIYIIDIKNINMDIEKIENIIINGMRKSFEILCEINKTNFQIDLSKVDEINVLKKLNTKDPHEVKKVFKNLLGLFTKTINKMRNNEMFQVDILNIFDKNTKLETMLRAQLREELLFSDLDAMNKDTIDSTNKKRKI